MDQIKVGLAAIKKHHFWVLCGVIVLVALIAWWTASSGLASRIEERRSQLDNQYTKVTGIPSGGAHPNQAVIDEIKREHGLLKGIVRKTWTTLWRDQKDKNHWPEELGRYARQLDALGPDQEIPKNLREIYMYFIKNHLPKLFDIVDLRLPPQLDENRNVITDENGKPLKVNPFEKTGGIRGMAAGLGSGYEDEYGGGGSTGYGNTPRSGQLIGKVDWDSANINQIRGDFYWTIRPTTDQVRLAQEDLWVYEALLRIIEKTNQGATSQYNAAVKRIQLLQIGKRASGFFAPSTGRGYQGGGSMMPTMGSGMGSMGMESMGMESMDMEYSDAEGGFGSGMGSAGYPGMSGGSSMGTGTSTASSPEEALRMQLLAYRYVDENGLPLAPDAEQFETMQFKMMPVRMLLIVDQRKITKLLVNCANSDMPVDVRRWALNPGKGKTVDFGRMMGPSSGLGYGGGEDGYDEGYPGGGMTGMTGSYPGAGVMSGSYPGGGFDGESAYDEGSGVGGRREQQNTFDVSIEILGIIYIYEPPEELETEAAGQEPAASPPGAAAAPTPTAPIAPAGPNP